MPYLDTAHLTNQKDKNNLLAINDWIHDTYFHRWFPPDQLSPNLPPTVLGPEGSKYSPDRKPSSGVDDTISDEFNDAIGAMWSWGNQGGATDTATDDHAVLVVPADLGQNRRCRFVTAPSAVDFAVYGKFHMLLQNNFAGGGLVLIDAGSIATPTSMWLHQFLCNTAITNSGAYARSCANYTDGPVSHVIHPTGTSPIRGAAVYLWWSYVASTKALSFHYSLSGYSSAWQLLSTQTLANHPAFLGRFGNSETSNLETRIASAWFRVFTVAAGATAAQLTGGQCGS